jgi:hypothetical protein
MIAVIALVAVATSGFGGSSPARSFRSCPGHPGLQTSDVGCARAAAVVHRFFGNSPRIRPGPSPSGWKCRQREAGHTSEGGDAYLVTCRSTGRQNRRLRYRWTSDLK